ncbi:ABC transporter ATP-binding protein [Terriglobus aquaticus]|uniref:ABC transporter ATP-binding protein n=1 Tax=Terriglobus aquaticus TaxID=940139 RepID=A0ABW9KGX3_9BACT|nr:ABC transporter ATP-binding protein [Terriglobus aquaticus]
MAEVHIRDVHKRHGDAHILRGIHLDIRDGEFVVLVGPSGCGKSTLLRMIAGLEEVTAGEIRIGSRVVNDLPAKDRDIAMVFQSYALYPHLTVAGNMGFSLRLKGMNKADIAAKVNAVAETLGLANLLDRFPRQLSGGQRQRVAMGRAIVRNPQVFLFDEPLSNLDAKLRISMRAEIKELHQRLQTTTIYVTHDQVEAMTLASRIVVLHGGTVEQIGTPMDLYDRPANQFVAGFIGAPAMNFLPAHLVGSALQVNSGPALPASISGAVATDAVTFGIRPEHLRAVAPAAPGSIAGTVAVVEPTGSETILIVQSVTGRLTALVRERIDLQPGQPVSLQPVPGLGHVFNAQGLRIGAA